MCEAEASGDKAMSGKTGDPRFGVGGRRQKAATEAIAKSERHAVTAECGCKVREWCAPTTNLLLGKSGAARSARCGACEQRSSNEALRQGAVTSASR